jgi:hypothetical protein
MNNYNPPLKEATGISPSLMLQQIKFELDIWKRQSELMLEENIHLKNTVAGFLQNDFTNIQLEEIESYLSKFLKKDELIAILKNEIATFERYLDMEPSAKMNDIEDLDLKLRFIRNDVLDTKMKFDSLQISFYNFLIKNIQYSKN